MALLIVLFERTIREAPNAVAQDVVDNPEASALPLISMNKNAAVLFARAAGQYSVLKRIADATRQVIFSGRLEEDYHT